MVLNPTPTPKITYWAPKSQKATPKLGQNKGCLENASSSAIQEDPINVFESYLNPKNSSFGPQTAKNNPKIHSQTCREHRN